MVRAFATFENGLQSGTESQFFPNGQLKVQGDFVSGKLHGTERRWHANGNLKAILHYEQGKVIKIVSVFDQDGEELSNIDPKEFFEDNSFDH